MNELTAPIVNIAAYKFVPLDRLEQRRSELRERCEQQKLKGTILLSPEGINLFLAGSRLSINQFLTELQEEEAFADLVVKESLSHETPFGHMRVKLKREIIAFGIEDIRPAERTSPKLLPTELKRWLDEGRSVTLLDVRNDYEIEHGTFAGATSMQLDHFRHFPTAASKLSPEIKPQPVVMFCTGGIRCEKAGPFLEQQGFVEVYQLDGGILRYFEDCGGAHYDGDCFVFDDRIAIDPNLKPVTPADVTKTVYHAMGIPNLEATDLEGRPYNLLAEGAPLTDLF